jgi:hypothetical protein
MALGCFRFVRFQFGNRTQDSVFEFAQSRIVRAELHSLLHLLQRRTKEINNEARRLVRVP